DDDVGLGADDGDLALHLGPVDVGADAIEAHEAELDAAIVANLPVAEAADADIVLGQQQDGVVHRGGPEVGEVVVGAVGQRHPRIVQPGNGVGVAAELETAVYDRTSRNQRGYQVDEQQVPGAAIIAHRPRGAKR